MPDEFDLSRADTGLAAAERAEPAAEFAADLGGSMPATEPAASTEPAPIAAPAEPQADVPMLDDGDDFDFLADADEVATKLDLARAYIDMGDTDGARDILDEVLQEGTDAQREEASTLLGRLG